MPLNCRFTFWVVVVFFKGEGLSGVSKKVEISKNGSFARSFTRLEVCAGALEG